LPDRPRDWVFFLTFGLKQTDRQFDESASAGGVFRWQSQPQQRLADSAIKEVLRAKALRGIEDAKSRTKWISDYRAFPNCDVERGQEYLASLRCIMSHGNNDIID
jgi:hypothetical protein